MSEDHSPLLPCKSSCIGSTGAIVKHRWNLLPLLPLLVFGVIAWWSPLSAIILSSLVYSILIFAFIPLWQANPCGTLHLVKPWSWRNIVLKFLEENKNQHTEIVRCKGITDNLPAAVLIADADGKVLYCSPYTEVLTGYSIDEVAAAGRDFMATVMHEKYRGTYARAIQFFDAGEPYQFQHRFMHKTGIEVWAETRTTPLFNADGDVSAFLSVTLNISQQMVYQRQVELRTKEIEDFTYMISHDLKSPLFTLRGMLGLLEEYNSQLPPQALEIFSHVHRAVQRLETLVNSVLEYAQISATSLALEPVPLRDVLTQVCGDFATDIVAFQVALSIDENLPFVEGERVRLSQIFANLMSNAIKYRDQSRILTLEIAVLPQHSKRQITVFFRDNGTGIPANKVSAIFSPFQRAHGASIEGTGIGLACVKKLMEKFGGEVEVESEQGTGSTFFLTFRLPPHHHSFAPSSSLREQRTK